MNSFKKISIALLLGGLGLGSFSVQAAWPEKAVKIVVPFPPGNSSDVSMRLLAEMLSPKIGQAVIVENRVGAGGTIGTAYAGSQAPDGYTLFMGSTGPLTIGPLLKPETVAYDTLRDFEPIAAIAWAPQVMVVKKDAGFSNVKEMIAAAKKPGAELRFGTSGVGTTPHLVISKYLHDTGIKALHVPYKGGSQSLTDLIGGQVDFISDNVPVVAAALQGGRVKPIGVTSSTRIPNLPDIPTLAEQGVEDFDLQGWILLMAPAGLPKQASDRLGKEISEILKTEQMRERLLEMGLVPMNMAQGKIKPFLENEKKKWREVIDISGAKAG